MTFSIRDLFWLLTLAAVLTTWWVDRSRLSTAKDGFERDAYDMGRYSDPFAEGLVAERYEELRNKYYFKTNVPIPSAPAQNPPKQ